VNGYVVPAIAYATLGFKLSTLENVLTEHAALLVDLNVNERSSVLWINSIDAKKRP
jgi:hypothetical protein